MSNVRVCATCGGTGRIFCANSWFPADGYTQVRCGICDGTGLSNYRSDAAYIKRQAQIRAHVARKCGDECYLCACVEKYNEIRAQQPKDIA